MGRGKSELTKRRLQAAYEILEQIHPASVRAACYQLFNRKLIASMEDSETQKMSRVLRDARLAYDIPCDWIVDETRSIEKVATWNDPETFADVVMSAYKRNKWDAQESEVIVVSEKGTVRGTLLPILQKYEVGFLPVGGFAGFNKIKGLTNKAEHKPLTVLYVGDFDPSGLCMSEKDIPKRLVQYFENDEYGMSSKKDADNWSSEEITYWLNRFKITFKRLALRGWDCWALGQDVSFPASKKKDDKRYRWFVENYGDLCWELDAMNPNDLRERVESAIKSQINFEVWNRYVHAEEIERKHITETVSTWKSIFNQDSK